MAMPDSNPRFTVIIPTKDRAAYLRHTLRTCEEQDYDNLDVVVSDDGSRDDTRDVVEEFAGKDSRIRYASPGDGAGMLDNFEFALDQAKPGYVIALGGDDGLMPHGIRGMLDVLRDTGQEMLCWPTPVYFYANTRMPHAQLILYLKGGRLQTGQRVITSRSFLERQAREFRYVGDIESPMFYVKGVTSTKLVDSVRSRSANGRFYSCATPDGYSGIVLAGEVESYAFSGTPFSLHGVSPTSAGVGYLAGTEEARKQSKAFFKSASRRPMHRELGSLPYSPLISLMTADYLLTARDLPGWPGVFPKIDFRELLVKGIEEVQDGLFAKENIARELSILYGVAKHHGLGDFFRDRVRKARRNTRAPLEGNAFAPRRLYLDAAQNRIENVFDAANFAYVAHSISVSLSGSTLWKAITNSARYRMLSVHKGESLPDESEWMNPSPSRAAED
jgi:glycosyltransferase involved in cell wall biosynthesis